MNPIDGDTIKNLILDNWLVFIDIVSTLGNFEQLLWLIGVWRQIRHGT